MDKNELQAELKLAENLWFSLLPTAEKDKFDWNAARELLGRYIELLKQK